MSKTTLLAIAAAITAIANDLGGDTPSAPSETPNETSGKRRGRPPGSGSTDTNEDKKPTGLSLEELKEKVKPLLDAGQGAEVKAIVAKYSSSGLKDLPADKQAAFLRDIEALAL